MDNKNKPGFTLVELIIVVALLSIQAAVLFPLLERANENNRNTDCKSNLKRCGVALLLYLNDYDSALPSSVTAVYGVPPTQEQVIRFLTGPPMAVPSDPEPSRSWCDVLNDRVQSRNSFFCPSALPRGRTPYWMKYAMDLAWRDPLIAARREADYNFASDQIVFYEPAGWHVGDAAGLKNAIQINVAYLDTHVETIVVQNAPTAYPPAADQRSGAAGVRLGEPMYYNYDSETSTQHPGVADYIDPRRYRDAN